MINHPVPDLAQLSRSPKGYGGSEALCLALDHMLLAASGLD